MAAFVISLKYYLGNKRIFKTLLSRKRTDSFVLNPDSKITAGIYLLEIINSINKPEKIDEPITDKRPLPV